MLFSIKKHNAQASQAAAPARGANAAAPQDPGVDVTFAEGAIANGAEDADPEDDDDNNDDFSKKGARSKQVDTPKHRCKIFGQSAQNNLLSRENILDMNYVVKDAGFQYKGKTPLQNPDGTDRQISIHEFKYFTSGVAATMRVSAKYAPACEVNGKQVGGANAIVEFAKAQLIRVFGPVVGANIGKRMVKYIKEHGITVDAQEKEKKDGEKDGKTTSIMEYSQDDIQEGVQKAGDVSRVGNTGNLCMSRAMFSVAVKYMVEGFFNGDLILENLGPIGRRCFERAGEPIKLSKSLKKVKLNKDSNQEGSQKGATLPALQEAFVQAVNALCIDCDTICDEEIAAFLKKPVELIRDIQAQMEQKAQEIKAAKAAKAALAKAAVKPDVINIKDDDEAAKAAVKDKADKAAQGGAGGVPKDPVQPARTDEEVRADWRMKHPELFPKEDAAGGAAEGGAAEGGAAENPNPVISVVAIPYVVPQIPVPEIPAGGEQAPAADKVPEAPAVPEVPAVGEQASSAAEIPNVPKKRKSDAQGGKTLTKAAKKAAKKAEKEAEKEASSEGEQEESFHDPAATCNRRGRNGRRN